MPVLGSQSRGKLDFYALLGSLQGHLLGHSLKKNFGCDGFQSDPARLLLCPRALCAVSVIEIMIIRNFYVFSANSHPLQHLRHSQCAGFEGTTGFSAAFHYHHPLVLYSFLCCVFTFSCSLSITVLVHSAAVTEGLYPSGSGFRGSSIPMNIPQMKIKARL